MINSCGHTADFYLGKSDLGQIHQKSPEVNSSRVLFYLGEKFWEGVERVTWWNLSIILTDHPRRKFCPKLTSNFTFCIAATSTIIIYIIILRKKKTKFSTILDTLKKYSKRPCLVIDPSTRTVRNICCILIGYDIMTKTFSTGWILVHGNERNTNKVQCSLSSLCSI